jgi:hypothetical protein
MRQKLDRDCVMFGNCNSLVVSHHLIVVKGLRARWRRKMPGSARSTSYNPLRATHLVKTLVEHAWIMLLSQQLPVRWKGKKTKVEERIS